MGIDDGHIDERDIKRLSEDTPPLMSLVPEPPPSHWGKVTSQSRTLSPQYLRFLGRKEVIDGKRQS